LHNKIVLLALMGILLVLAAYSSSTHLVFAVYTSCDFYAGKTKATCTNSDEDGDITRWVCEKLKNGNWTCVQLISSSTGNDIPPDLRDAISKAQAQGVKPDMSLGESQSGNNDTKSPKDLGGFNKGENGPTIKPGQ